MFLKICLFILKYKTRKAIKPCTRRAPVQAGKGYSKSLDTGL